MRQKKVKTYDDIYAVRLIYHLGSILGIAPPFDFKNHKLIKCEAYKYGVFVLIVLTVFGFGYSTWGRIMYVYPVLPFFSKVITDSILNVTLTITNICSIITPTFISAKCYEKFLNMFTHQCHLDKLGFNQLKIERIKNSRNELIMIHILTFILSFSEAYVWITFASFYQFSFYIIRLIQNYYLIIMAYFIISFMRLLAFRFEAINKILIKLNDDALSEKIVYVTDQKKAAQRTVSQVFEAYSILMEQVSLFNTVFGWQVLLLVATILAAFIDFLNCILTFGLIWNGLVTGLSCLWTLEALIMGVICAACCEKATMEAYRTGQLSYQLLLNLSGYENFQCKILQDKLNILAELSTHRCPQFTAAGFFKINYTMILSLLGAVTSYFIIIVQFN